MTAKFFARVPMRAASDRRLTERALRALIVICWHADQTGRAWPSLQTIAEESGIDRRSLHRPIVKLVDTGYLRIERRRDQAGDPDTNLYIVLFDEGVSAQQPIPVGSAADTVSAQQPIQVSVQEPHKQTLLTDHLTRARVGSPDGRRRSRYPRPVPERPTPVAIDDDVEARAHMRAFLRDGTWKPAWGATPSPDEAAAA
jgi:DNA-binding MarR family transcriptional regulator